MTRNTTNENDKIIKVTKEKQLPKGITVHAVYSKFGGKKSFNVMPYMSTCRNMSVPMHQLTPAKLRI